ncbi:PREDICTED: eukaryotic translation initiation factor 2-alpha kinase 4 isoform X2 [Haliaeetus leucocephalus]|uniref:eukaryotic translation initiation factor 2-alpha kinase 4 isoform X2 n=1 Tax=Haliaeetus leucocephalus TaxID=52644 RepID=UPI00053CDF61|nr:PREDICTED: eukaryotic translation initiation factor 2-alpha kinase 4 isoform X2 [Haliaeetus leucocephalus]
MARARGAQKLPAEVAAEPPESYQLRQENELQALESIYGQDFQDLRQSQAWKVRQPPEINLVLRPQGLTGDNEVYAKVDLWVKCPHTYPDTVPEIQLKNSKGLSKEKINELKSRLGQLAKQRCGEVMIFELANHVQSFLSEYNKPPSKSFHEEMLKNHQKEQERLAQEELRRAQEVKRREEQEQREILNEIQRREEEKREERKKKEIAKQERLEIAALTSQENSHRRDTAGYRVTSSLNGSCWEHGVNNKHRPNSAGRSKRERQLSVSNNEESPGNYEVLNFSTSGAGQLIVHKGKCLGKDEQLGKSLYNALEIRSGDFVLIYEWVLHWQKKMGRFLTTHEMEKIEKCKKQLQGAETEFSSLTKLSHPNIVHYKCMNLKERDDSIVVDILVEHISGCSLSTYLQKETPVPVEQLRHYVTQILSALDYLHNNSVVHKVLCASSILVDAEGNIKVTDYSISKRLADICKADVFEQTKVRFSEDGLPSKPGKKGDVWSLGLLLLSLSQGQVTKEYPVAVPTNLPADFKDFLEKCVCLEDKERWTPQQLLQHSFINIPRMKIPVAEENLDDSAGIDCIETVVPSSQISSASFFTETQRQFSRYYNEFEELKLLGKGAFGAVVKVRNKLDGCYYAVKRIRINPASKQFRRIKGEVTLLSRLNHENIVRYYNAWIEKHESPVPTASSSETTEEKRMPTTSGLFILTTEETNDVEANAPPPVLTSSVEWSTSCERSSSNKFSGADQESSDDDDDGDGVFSHSFLPTTDSESDIIFDNEDENSNPPDEEGNEKNGHGEEDSTPVIQTVHYLYIQMEYCEKSTLRDTIDQGLYEDTSRLWRLFREILDGLAYIHEKVASKQEENHSDSSAMSDPSGNLTGMVGTALYVSPEVQGSTKSTYNQKVDLFSLGIIFFEMSYHPMSTASERIFVLGQLRLPTIVFPKDFDEVKHAKQRLVITWLLNHDPAARPTAVELLKSEHLPPPQMEESELHEVLHHTLANVDGKAYRTMMSHIFSQRISPAIDYTYDSDMLKGSFSIWAAKIQQHVCEIVSRIFKRHGAIKLHTPLLMPRNKKLYEHNEASYFMDQSGMLVMLPYDLRISFARFVARNNISNLKRYCIERVFRPRKLDRCHPKELLECAFDIITSTGNSFLPIAETIYAISEIIQEFSVLQERKYSIYLNHTALLKAILLHCGIPEDKLNQVYIILYDAVTEKLTKREVEAKFCNLSLTSNSLSRLYRFIEQKGEASNVFPFLNTMIKQKPGVTQLLKHGMKDLEEIIGLLKQLGIKLQVSINLGLVYKIQQHNGIIFQFIAYIKRRQRTVPEILAAGGRYDHLIPQFRGPQMVGPIPSAVGVSVAIDKITAAVSSVEDSVSVSSCDLLVVSVGQMSMGRAVNIVQKLWTVGIPAEIMYDWSQSQEELQEYCRCSGITYVALVSDKEGSHVKVKSFEKDRQTEKRILESDLIDHLIQKLKIKICDERCSRETSDNLSVPNQKGSFTNISGVFESHGTLVPNVSVIAPEKLSASARRRQEIQVQTRLQTFISSLQQKTSEIEILAVDLPKATVIHFLSLEFYGDRQAFDATVKQLMSRWPKQRCSYLQAICDEIYSIKMEKRVPALILYSYRDEYKVLF